MLLIGIFYLYLSIKALQEVPSLLVVFACALCNAENFEVTVASLLQDFVLCSKKKLFLFPSDGQRSFVSLPTHSGGPRRRRDRRGGCRQGGESLGLVRPVYSRFHLKKAGESYRALSGFILIKQKIDPASKSTLYVQKGPKYGIKRGGGIPVEELTKIYHLWHQKTKFRQPAKATGKHSAFSP